MSAEDFRLDYEARPPGSEPTSHRHQAHLQTLQPIDSSMVKLTRGTSCVLCQQRKVRCDRNKPCANCAKAGVECKVVPPQPPRRRKKRLQERDLIDRLRKYELLLSENGIKFDAIGNDLRSDGPHIEEVDDLENDFEGLKTSSEANSSPLNNMHAPDKPRRSIFSLHREFRASEQMLHDSSEDEEEESTIHRAFDRMFSNNDGFPFVFSGRQQSTTHYHPPAIQIFQLWQTYIDNVNSLLKITHVPSIQGQIIQASSNLDSAHKNIEALMFAIYAMAVASMDERDVEKMFQQSKKQVLGHFLEALQQALLNANFMRTNDFISLQAYVLYLMVLRWSVDPRQVFCLIGIAVRIAQRMGLHQDPAGYGLPPFEIEQRRRLWWTIVSYDRRIGEMTGSTVTALSSGGNCKLPLNVNDSDLHIDGKELPAPHTGPTEMLFALTRLEIAMAVASDSNRDSAKINPDKSSPSSSSQGFSKPREVPTIRIAGQDSPSYTLEGFCAHMEGTYLSQCDPKIPLHFFTITMTRQTLSKMRVISYLMRMSNGGDSLGEIERENLFLLSIRMVEYDNVVHQSESLKPFKWFTAHHFPFPAYMFLVQELRQRCYGHMVERAWEAIATNHELRGMVHNVHSPMHAAFGRQFIKAWNAHSEACVANGREAPTPPLFVDVLRGRNNHRRKLRQKDSDPVTGNPSIDASGSNVGTSPEGNDGAMVTPPSVGNHLGSSITSNFGLGGTPNPEPSDMDWSYLVSNFTPDLNFAAPGFQGFQNFGAFGTDYHGSIPRMGGAGPGGPGAGSAGGMY